MENLPNGATSYVFQTLAHFKTFLDAFADKPWVTQGIVSIMAIPWTGEYSVNSTSAVVAGVTILTVSPGSLTTKTTPMQSSWRQNIVLGPQGRYQSLEKFLTYPYTVLEMTSYTGTPLLLKPESWADAHASAASPALRAARPEDHVLPVPGTTPRSPARTRPPTLMVWLTTGANSSDMATGITNFPTFSLVNNGYMAFMASNNNSITYQHLLADWSQQRALGGNQLSAEQATGSIGTSQDVNSQGINASQASRDLANTNAALNGVRSGINLVGSIGNGPGGMISAATGMVNAGIGTAMSINTNNMSTDIANTLSRGTNRAVNDQAGYVRDTNKQYGDWAAKGDYQNVIAGINAKVQDAKLIQPTTAGQVGGDAFTLATYKWGYDIKVKNVAGCCHEFHRRILATVRVFGKQVRAYAR